VGELKAYRVGALSTSHTCRFSALTSSQVNTRTPAGCRQIAVLRRGNGALGAQPSGQACGCRSTVVDAGGGRGGERG
jgi:hypothetical protein